MKLSKNFSREEMKCPCCNQDTVDAELIMVLQDIRDHFNEPVFISSGNRCRSYNFTVNGSINSQHIHSKAADLKVKFVSPQLVADYLEDKYPDKYGIGRYGDRFTHIDVRQNKARWHE